MDTLKIIISKANSIHFKHVDGKMPSFDNRLSYEETWNSKPTFCFKHTFFKDDVVLVQIKAGLTATVLLQKVTSGGTTSTITSAGTTTYTEFKIYDYTMTLSTLEEFYLLATSQESEWKSEWVEVINEDEELTLLQWSNEDQLNNTFEFDYQTTTAKANVNFMRMRAEMLEYKPGGERKIYKNQTEVTQLKSNLFRILTFKSEPISRQIAEKIIIAMNHDLFLINEVGFVLEENAEIIVAGGAAEVKAELTQRVSRGFNTHDIGYTP